MKIAAKIKLTFAIGATVVLALGLFDYLQSRRLEAELAAIRLHTNNETRTLVGIHEAVSVLHYALDASLETPAGRTRSTQAANEAVATLQAGLAHLQELEQAARDRDPGVEDPRGPVLRTELNRVAAELAQNWSEYIGRLDAGHPAEAAALRTQLLQPALSDEFRPALDSYTSYLRQRYSRRVDRLTLQTNRAMILKLTGGGILLVLAGLAAVLIHRGVLAPLRRFEAAAARAASGEGDFRADASRRDELGAVARALTGMLGTIHENTVTKAQLESALQARTRESSSQESELRAKSERLALALDASRTAIWDFDIPANRVIFDPGWSAMLGGPPVETTCSIPRLLAIVHPDDRARVQAATGTCYRGESEEYSEEYRVRNHQGRWIWLQTKGRVAGLDPSGRATRLIGTNTDVTARKEAELAIGRQVDFLNALNQTTLALLQRQSRTEILDALAERAASLLDSAQVEVALVEGDELVTHAYGGATRMEAGARAGRQEAVISWRAVDTRRPVIVDSYSTLPEVSPHYHEARFQAVAVFPILLGERCLGVLAFLRHEPGRAYTAAESGKGALLAQLAALVIHNASIYEDALRVAEHRTAALRESEAMFKGVFDESPIPIILLSAAGGQIREVNKAASLTFGYAREEVVGRTTLELSTWIDPSVRTYLIQRLQSEGAVRGYETRMRTKDGRMLDVIYNASRVTLGGEPILLSSVIDITPQKQAEAALRQSEAHLRQAQKMESLGTLAGGIAHDFNNILTGILGHTHLAVSDLPANHPIQPWLQGILQSGARARDLVQQILTFSRKTETALLPVKLQLVLAETLGLLRSTLPAMVRIEPAIDAACPPVLADSTQIHQVVLNLCTNAWHALPPSGGLIEIQLAPHGVTAEFAAAHPPLKPGPHVRLRVRDNGRGMSPATLERIFEPFFTTKEAGKGTGLGLAVVHSVVSTHGGAITVQSAPGEGTSFEIYLPALDAPVPTHGSRPPTAVPAGRGESVLVVDDEPASGQVIALLAERLGYRTTLCSDPFKAVALLYANDFALLVTDLAMPGLPGDELARQALARKPGLPVLLISGFIEPDKLEQLRRDGVREVLGKPPTYEDLAHAMQRCLLTAVDVAGGADL